MTTAVPRTLTSLLVAAGAVCAALAALLLAATPATAHASLAGSTPGDGEVVATAPAEITLTFTEAVSLADDGVRVLDPDGDAVATGGETADLGDHTYAVALPGDDLADGTYTVTWQVVSADSHPISGAFTFSVGAPSETSVEPGAVAETGDDGVSGLLYDVARYTAYGGFVLLGGACAFALACWPVAASRRTVQRVTLTGWTALTASTIALLLLRTPYTGSGDLADAFDLGGLRDVIDTKTGTALVTRLLLLAAAGVFIAVLHGGYARQRALPDPDEATAERVRDLTFGLALGGSILAAGIAASWAMSEHASTGRQTGLAIPLDIVHLLAVSAWLGGLVTLLVLLRTEPALPRSAVRRFSAVALTSVTVLAVTGLYQAWRQIGWSWSALTETSYGQLLLIKVALVVTLLTVAWASRRRTGRLDDARPDAAAADSADAEAPAEAGAEAASAPEPVAVGAGGAAEGEAAVDPERARQLARQRAAVARAGRVKARDADPHRSGLRRSVLAEVALAAVLLAVTTGLTGTTPARTAAAEAAQNGEAGAGENGPPQAQDPGSLSLPYDTGGDSGQGTALIELTPARTGENTMHIRLTDPEGAPTGAAEVRVALTLPSEDPSDAIGPLRLDPLHVDVGHWTATGVQLPRPGAWELALTIRTSDVDQITETTTVTIE
ncbi:copper resistance CopC/CopD family protein [Streptomyces sp. SBT349]|uniref:copper resistance CopC/CopD family protein n=1 Tax=Streptomyces sp. SBT349 TaxID=1580539 RepID=UPI00066CD697|nr:copper resistance protein CopC [Streptomyces sp. SBT349]